MSQVNIYKGHKQLCYIKNLKINGEKLISIETEFEIVNKSDEFYYNRLGVLMDISGNVVLNPEDADGYLRYLAEQYPNQVKDIKCSCVDSKQLTYSRTISRKELKILKKTNKK